jgi:hypothetical protein
MNSKKQLITRIKGGLGNQLFIYASSYGLAKKFKRELILDTESGYKNDPFGREYLLKKFNISAQSNNKIYSGTTGRIKRAISKRICEHLPHNLRWYLLDSIKTHFHNSTFGQFENLYLDGYLQSDEYFKDYRTEIIRELEITGDISAQVQLLSDQIKEDSKSVIVGVRRFKEVKKGPHVPILDSTFYDKCFDLIESKISSPNYYVVTEDIEWAMENLPKRQSLIFVPHIPENNRAHENLYLMTKASHFIIANSTYHWWGAWLSQAPNKIVLAPRDGWIHPKPTPECWLTV